jgi:hypothetical protein
VTSTELTYLERELAAGTELFSAAVVRRLVEDVRRLRSALKRVGLAAVCGGTEDAVAIPDLVNEALS